MFVRIILGAAMVLAAGESLAQDRGTGLKLTNDYANLPKRQTLTKNKNSLPKEISLAAYMPEPRSQGASASCVPWALGHAMASYYTRSRYEDAENTTLSPEFMYHWINQGGTCSTKISLAAGLDHLKIFGAVPDGDYKEKNDAAMCFIDKEKLSEKYGEQATPYRIEDWRRLQKGDAADGYNIAIKDAVSKGHPVAVSLPVFQGFRDLGSDVYRLTAEEKAELSDAASREAREHHAVVVIAFDDSKEQGAFLVQNSWLPWGLSESDAGRGWIDYDSAASLFSEAFLIQDLPAGGETAEFTGADIRNGVVMIAKIDKDRTAEICAHKLARRESRRHCKQKEGSNYNIENETCASVIAEKRKAAHDALDDLLASGKTTNKTYGGAKERGKCRKYRQVWLYLDLPESKLRQVKRVEYKFTHSSYKFQVNEAGKLVDAKYHEQQELLAGYPLLFYSYGCAQKFIVTAELTSGDSVEESFKMCDYFKAAIKNGVPTRIRAGDPKKCSICKRTKTLAKCQAGGMCP